jgi:hypothetical protein
MYPKKNFIKINKIKNIPNLKPSIVAYAYNPSLRTLRQEDHEFNASLGYIASSRPT